MLTCQTYSRPLEACHRTSCMEVSCAEDHAGRKMSVIVLTACCCPRFTARPIAGRLEEEAVVIQVQRTSQRVKSTAVLPNSAVVAEARQWLGVAIRPLHDRLEGARVQIYPSNRMSTSSPASEHIELSILKETPAFIAPLSDAQGRPLHLAEPLLTNRRICQLRSGM